MKSNSTFYNSASLYYDKMMDFDSALQKRKELLSGFIASQIKTAADVGCGTGQYCGMTKGPYTGIDLNERYINLK